MTTAAPTKTAKKAPAKQAVVIEAPPAVATIEQPLVKDDIQFTERTLPWLQYGTVLDHPATSEEAVKLSGLDFTVSGKPAGYQNEDGTWTTVTNRKAMVRDDTGAPFEFVGAGYQPFQFSEAFDFMDQIHPNYVAGGALRGGRQGFLVVQPDRVIAPAGDKIDLFVVLRTSHDRSRGIEIALMPLRGKCMNQLTLQSFSRAAKQRWSISHTANLHEKLHQAQHAMAQLDEYTTMFDGLAERLMLQSPTEAQARAILQKVVKHGGKKKDEEIEQILHLWHEDTDRVGFNDTGWGLLNAVSEQLEWRRPRQHGGDRFLSGLQGYVHQSVTTTARALFALAA